MAECRYGVEIRSRYAAWNEACPRCREEHAAYERATSRINGQAGFSADTEDHLKGFEKHRPWAQPMHPKEKQMLDGGVEFVRSRVHPFGRTSTERRVSERVHKVRWALEVAPWALTPAQRQALAMVYGCIIPPAKCARLLGIERQESGRV